ncbi:restriction system-associated AAA family ATPase [Dyella marensis]|uniref:restriction system-associated AAA family ATPase n=1 Tax=Dyella marensis TaxID=500610 RepID=UPI0031DA44C3
MKLLRLKITDAEGFRSLPPGFEHVFRTEWTLQDEAIEAEGFAPFVCAGPNGSGKSNLLEALAAIFFQLEVQRVSRSFLPEALSTEDQDGAPAAYELEYLMRLPRDTLPYGERYAHVRVIKEPGKTPRMFWLNPENFASFSGNLAVDGLCGEYERDFLLPTYVLGYSSGENEILSLPFFKMRFVQFDEYWRCLKDQMPYPGRPDSRLAYLDNGFSQAILLCSLLFEDEPFRQDVGIETLQQFRIVLQRSIPLQPEQLAAFASKDESETQSLDEIVRSNPAIRLESDETGGTRYRVNLMQLLEGDERSSLVVSALKRCATLSYLDQTTDTLILDYWVNEATREAFRENFDYAFYQSPLALFHAFQVLLTLNLYAVSDALKDDLYKSKSHYVTETVPTLASDQRIMRFKNFYFTKRGVERPMLLKELSDGEHQLLHSLGLCLLFRHTNALFLLDEPETHFNPDWRSNFISQLRNCLYHEPHENIGQEMLITTHAPFLISDSKPDKVLIFKKDEAGGTVSVCSPGYNTLGASINKITMNTFGKRETIGAYAKEVLDQVRARFNAGNEDPSLLIDELNRELGDSVEKILLIKAILDKAEGEATGVQV